jgi:hypothetical protein
LAQVLGPDWQTLSEIQSPSVETLHHLRDTGNFSPDYAAQYIEAHQITTHKKATLANPNGHYYRCSDGPGNVKELDVVGLNGNVIAQNGGPGAENRLAFSAPSALISSIEQVKEFQSAFIGESFGPPFIRLWSARDQVTDAVSAGCVCLAQTLKDIISAHDSLPSSCLTLLLIS